VVTVLNCFKGVATFVQNLVFFSQRVVSARNSIPISSLQRALNVL